MPEDLSSGDLPEEDREKSNLGLAEEKQRLRWKTGVLWGGATIIVSFYAIALLAIHHLVFGDEYFDYLQVVLIAFLLIVPTLIALNFLKLIAGTPQLTQEDFDSHPLVRLVRETVSAFSSK